MCFHIQVRPTISFEELEKALTTGVQSTWSLQDVANTVRAAAAAALVECPVGSWINFARVQVAAPTSSKSDTARTAETTNIVQTEVGVNEKRQAISNAYGIETCDKAGDGQSRFDEADLVDMDLASMRSRLSRRGLGSEHEGGKQLMQTQGFASYLKVRTLLVWAAIWKLIAEGWVAGNQTRGPAKSMRTHNAIDLDVPIVQ